jgi:hypothetical protein
MPVFSNAGVFFIFSHIILQTQDIIPHSLNALSITISDCHDIRWASCRYRF